MSRSYDLSGRRMVRRRRASMRSGRERALRRSLVAAGFLVSILAGVVLYFLPAIQVALRDTGQVNTSLGGTAQLKPVSASEHLSSTSPFTLLLLGSDSDSKFKGDYLTQSMILTRVDPATKQVTMLSIPRDLWVRLCNGSNGKIDQAFLHGGAQCAIQTVQRNLQGPRRLLRVDRAPGSGFSSQPARRRQCHRQQPCDGRLLPGGPLRRQPVRLPENPRASRRAAHEWHARARVRPRSPRRCVRRLRTIPAPATDPHRTARQDQARLTRRCSEFLRPRSGRTSRPT